MPQLRNEDIGKLIIRVTCAALLMMHGTNSLIYGIQHIKDILRNAGLPEFFAYGNLIGEFFAPLFMIIGYKARLAALVVAFNMLLSIVLAHTDIMFARNNYGGWMIELNIFYMMTAMA